MVREILFKAKRKDNGEWVGGYYFWVGEKHMILNFSTDESDTYHNMYEIDPETLCQYTGLTDKNDNKIWENDIVREDWRNEKGVVKFGEFEAQVLKNIGFNIEWDYINYRQDICYWAGKCEVIGNVFDNPELLEGGNE